MKRGVVILGGLALAVVALALVSGCEWGGGMSWEECTPCHDDEARIASRQVQWAQSGHALGGTFERADPDCAGCHTSQGFVEVLATGADATAEEIDNPAPVKCRTCHNIHTDYSEDDWNLRTEEAVTLKLTGDAVDIGKGNLCVQCHQPRGSYLVPVEGEDVDIASDHWGPHHSTQGAIFAGLGGFEISGSVPYANSDHTVEVRPGCPGCHMAKPYGSQAGGHQMGLTYEYHEEVRDYVAVCNVSHCHDDREDFNPEGKGAEIETLLLALRAELEEAGILNADEVVHGTWDSTVAGALWNYLLVVGDGSTGIHNYRYTRALLQNSIEALQE